MKKINCWEFFDCERQAKDSDLGLCPAITATRADGLNNGHNGGRACWALAQTHCAGRLQGSVADKMSHCMKCEFRNLVVRQEEEELAGFLDILDRLKEC